MESLFIIGVVIFIGVLFTVVLLHLVRRFDQFMDSIEKEIKEYMKEEKEDI